MAFSYNIIVHSCTHPFKQKQFDVCHHGKSSSVNVVHIQKRCFVKKKKVFNQSVFSIIVLYDNTSIEKRVYFLIPLHVMISNFPMQAQHLIEINDLSLDPIHSSMLNFVLSFHYVFHQSQLGVNVAIIC